MAAPPTLNTKGLRCPLPAVMTEARLRKMGTGEKLRVIADDPLALVDIPHFCEQAGHEIEIIENDGSVCVFMVTVT